MEVENQESFSLVVPEDHSYCKSLPEPMDTSDSTPPTNVTTPSLTSLDRTQDNFESLLLLLLQSHTVQTTPPGEAATPTPPTAPALWDTGISGDALGTLSSEQLTTLITSNSVNYEVIQQILVQQKARGLGPGGRDQNELDLTGRCSKSPTPMHSPSASSSPPSTATPTLADTNQQLQQMIQISPEQLQSLQTQVNQLLQSQHLSLPPDLTHEQQQQLIQTLLLRQLHLQQSGGVATVTIKDGMTAMQQLLASNQAEKGASPPTSSSSSSSVVTAEETVVKRENKETKKEVAAKPLSGAAISSVQSGKGRGRKGSGKNEGGVAKPATGRGRKKKGADPAKSPDDVPYSLFFQEVYPTVYATKSKMGYSEAAKIILKMWEAMGPDVKKRYYDEHERRKALAEEEARLAQANEENQAGRGGGRGDTGGGGGGRTGPTIRSLIASAPVTASASDSSQEEPTTPLVPVENPAALGPAGTGSAAGATGDGQSVVSTLSDAGSGQPVAMETSEITSSSTTTGATAFTEIPKDPKLCQNLSCEKLAVYVEERGPSYCSNDCVVSHCRYDCVVGHCRKVFDMRYGGQKLQV